MTHLNVSIARRITSYTMADADLNAQVALSIMVENVFLAKLRTAILVQSTAKYALIATSLYSLKTINVFMSALLENGHY